jgi:hypothetical protein
MAQALKFLQVGQITVAVDGTKVMANASKHSAVSYEHAGKAIEQLDLEVKELMAKAEQADSTPLQEGLSIPEEITRRQERKAALAKARAEIEARPKRATPSSWPSMRRNWRSGPPKKKGVMVCAAGRPKRRRPNRVRAINTTSPTRKTGS